MTITFENNIKKINGRTLEMILIELPSSEDSRDFLIELFNTVNNREELVKGLKEVYKKQTPVYILLLIKFLCGYSIIEANDILDEVMKGGKLKN